MAVLFYQLLLVWFIRSFQTDFLCLIFIFLDNALVNEVSSFPMGSPQDTTIKQGINNNFNLLGI